MTIIKVCDIRDEPTAQVCVNAGVSMIGLHCIRGPISPEQRNCFGRIMRLVEPKVACVLVTRETNEEELVKISESLAWDYIQLHAVWEAEGILRLRRRLEARRCAVRLIGVVEATLDDVDRVGRIATAVDFLLIDSSLRGGTGIIGEQLYLERAVALAADKSFLVAGGLRTENVCGFIRRYRPYGVDVQTGVEWPDGTRRKNPVLIESFVSAVRDCEVDL
jgi:phosphoribosylanthranilate isomerase